MIKLILLEAVSRSFWAQRLASRLHLISTLREHQKIQPFPRLIGSILVQFNSAHKDNFPLFLCMEKRTDIYVYIKMNTMKSVGKSYLTWRRFNISKLNTDFFFIFLCSTDVRHCRVQIKKYAKSLDQIKFANLSIWRANGLDFLNSTPIVTNMMIF